jgi:hypothetical protein
MPVSGDREAEGGRRQGRSVVGTDVVSHPQGQSSDELQKGCPHPFSSFVHLTTSSGEKVDAFIRTKENVIRRLVLDQTEKNGSYQHKGI